MKERATCKNVKVVMGRPYNQWDSKRVTVPKPLLGEVQALIAKWKAEQE